MNEQTDFDKQLQQTQKGLETRANTLQYRADAYKILHDEVHLLSNKAKEALMFLLPIP